MIIRVFRFQRKTLLLFFGFFLLLLYFFFFFLTPSRLYNSKSFQPILMKFSEIMWNYYPSKMLKFSWQRHFRFYVTSFLKFSKSHFVRGVSQKRFKIEAWNFQWLWFGRFTSVIRLEMKICHFWSKPEVKQIFRKNEFSDQIKNEYAFCRAY